MYDAQYLPYMQGYYNGHAALTRVTAPTVEPVTLAEASLYVKMDHTTDDALITSLIVAARELCEVKTERSFVNTTWDLTLDYLPRCIFLPRSRLSSVTSLSYYATDGTLTVMSSADYVVDTASEPGRITQAVNATWPGTQDRTGAVIVRFVAGYGAAASSVPDSIKAAIQLLVGHWYENRESVVVGTITSELPMAVESLLAANAVVTMV